MKVADDVVVEFNYKLKDEEGNLLDSSDGSKPFVYTHGKAQVIPGIEKNLEGKQAGDNIMAVLPPDEAYGDYNDQLITQVKKDQINADEEIEVGMALQAQTPQGTQVLFVKGFEDENVILDANHPLAGKTLHFNIDVINVREATKEEMEKDQSN